MGNIIELPLSDKEDQKVYIEVNENVSENAFTKTGVGEFFTKSDKKFEDIKKTLINFCKPIKEALMSEINPDETTVEFGLKFNVNGNWILASSNVETHLKISMSWKNK